MIPVITIVGRPNVGKSTLFNCLTRSRDALVVDMPGVTRDRLYGQGEWQHHTFIVIDTGGMMIKGDYMHALTLQQTRQALAEADVILFVVSARDGVTAEDESVLATLRRWNKPIHLVVNKIDGVDLIQAESAFSVFGLKHVYYVAASHKRGVTTLVESVFATISDHSDLLPLGVDVLTLVSPGLRKDGIYLAVVGRPNAGKSTLVNRILGQERMLVSDTAGTTRDSIYIPVKRKGQSYVIIDTAGMRKRRKVHETVEKFSMIKSLQAIASCHVGIVLIDAGDGVTEQDLRLLRFVLEAGKSLVIVMNKWDCVPSDERRKLKKDIIYRLRYFDFANVHFISAKEGEGVSKLFVSINQAYQSAMQALSTSQLTSILEKALEAHQPPLINGRRVKPRYAHPGGHNPPCIVVHGKQVEKLPQAYQRYLINIFRKALKIVGNPIRLVLKNDKNPYAT